MSNINPVLSVRDQSELVNKILEQRLDNILPVAMKESGLDMWIILCQEDNPDPVFRTMIPYNCWTPILQMLIFIDDGDKKIERINLSITKMHGIYDEPWKGRNYWEQWPLLSDIIEQYDPKTIGVNIGDIQWAAGGLTYNLYQQLIKAIKPKYQTRLVNAEKACTRWLMTYSEIELEIYPYIVSIAHKIIAECYSDRTIIPGVTTTTDLQWIYWQKVNDLGLDISFTPAFNIIRDSAKKTKYGESDKTIRHGDIIHCDVGIRYLRLCTDHQEVAYVLRPGETSVPQGIEQLLNQNNRLQNVFMGKFALGLSGDELLKDILDLANEQKIPNPKVYSHSLGIYLHEPGPLIGLPWEQNRNPGRGDVRLDYNTGFTMELSIEDYVPEWDQMIRLGTEQDVLFTHAGCNPVDGVQTKYYVI